MVLLLPSCDSMGKAGLGHLIYCFATTAPLGLVGVSSLCSSSWIEHLVSHLFSPILVIMLLTRPGGEEAVMEIGFVAQLLLKFIYLA